MQKKTDDDFWDAYERMSAKSHCDAAGGMEYQRVFAEWKEAGRPTGLEVFIHIRANVLWDDSSPADWN